MKKLFLILFLFIPFAAEAMDAGNINLYGTINATKAYINGMVVTYEASNGVYISSGEAMVAGTYQTNSSTYNLTGSLTGLDIYYIYLSNAGAFSFSTTEPTYNDTYFARYKTGDATNRLIGAVQVTAGNVIAPFDAPTRNMYIFRAEQTVATGQNPDSSWHDTTTDVDTLCPVNASSVFVRVAGADSGAATWSQARSKAVPISSIQSFAYANSQIKGFLYTGTSDHSVEIVGEDDDDNSLACYFDGYILED